MWRFLLGFSIVGVVASSAALALTGPAGWLAEPEPARILMSLVLVPLFAAWMTAEAVHLLRPRRLFTGTRRASLFLLIAGGIAGVVALGLTLLALAFLGDVPDALVTSVTATIATLPTVLLLRPCRDGNCVYCGHRLRGMPAEVAHRCPECGHDQAPVSRSWRSRRSVRYRAA